VVGRAVRPSWLPLWAARKSPAKFSAEIVLALHDVGACAGCWRMPEVDAEVAPAPEELKAHAEILAEQVGDEQLEVVVGERGEGAHDPSSLARASARRSAVRRSLLRRHAKNALRRSRQPWAWASTSGRQRRRRSGFRHLVITGLLTDKQVRMRR
jgi:hypothetical protein